MEEQYFENPELEIGDEFETDRGERFKVVDKKEDGTPFGSPLKAACGKVRDSVGAGKPARSPFAGLRVVVGNRNLYSLEGRPTFDDLDFVGMNLREPFGVISPAAGRNETETS